MLKTSQTSAPSIGDLTQSLNRLCDDQPFQSGWYLKDLSTGESADSSGHVVVTSASLLAVAPPIPQAPPVTMATLSASLAFRTSVCCLC